MKGIILLAVVILQFGVCYAQSHQSIIGLVFKAGSGIRVSNVSIKNIRSGSLTMTNDRGEFKISVNMGDTLELVSDGYSETRVIIRDFKDKVIQLRPQNVLAEVIVKATPIDKDLREVEDGYRAKGIYYKGKPPISLLSPFGGSPLTYLSELTSKDAKQARRFDEFTTREEEYAEINKRFNDKVIMSLVTIQIQHLQEFKERFRPTIVQIRKWNEVELYDYIKKSYREFIIEKLP